MALLIKAGETTAANKRVYFQCVDATDGMTPETGEAAGQPQISTNGAAFTDTGIGTLIALGNGRYYGELTDVAVDTAGRVIESRYKSAATAEAIGTTVQVVAFDPHAVAGLGLTNLNATVGSRSSHAAADVATLVLVTPANKLATDVGGYVSRVTLVDTVTALANDAVSAAAMKADAVTEIQAGLAATGEAAAALSSYDPPTKAEMDAGHALLATPAQVNTEADTAITDALGNIADAVLNEEIASAATLKADSLRSAAKAAQVQAVGNWELSGTTPSRQMTLFTLAGPAGHVFDITDDDGGLPTQRHEAP